MSWTTWVTSIFGLGCIILTNKIIMPSYYFISNLMMKMGAPAEIGLKLEHEFEWGLYILGFGCLVLPIIISLWKREETAQEWS